MITTRFDELRRTKGLKEDRDLSLRQVSEETGLGFNTLQRLRKGETERVALSTLDKLCDYFGLESLCELIEREKRPGDASEYVPDAEEEEAA